MSNKSILVTGGSSGLGHAAARKLANSGFYVFATVREIHGIFDKMQNIEELKIDVTNDQSVKEAFHQIESRQEDYPLWGLVNNAGICIPSPLELLEPAEFRRQLDTNVVGQLLVTQAALPLIRSNKGRIINVTSGLGSIAVPYLGAYSIAQFAKMAFTDALRRELKHSGVSVSVVQPGAIYTPIWEKILAAGQDILNQSVSEKRKIYAKSFLEFLKVSEEGARLTMTTENDFAEVVLNALNADIPATHYYVGNDAKDFIDKSHTLTAAEIDSLFDAHSPTSREFEDYLA
ncbi:SDR family NAD(P)-dependent oxidoreductase [Xenorhabdus bovienii]|uniref:SDR family NAD(P)-dependent oxidoreductase n=1 Tax=Xenorhabdus bovienii TaxID=40576 RepID=UPI00237CBBB1|nr:SDR family NAD(P)-dependent oxidoreductase [Xenorhabdus bovienii]MDE1490798.1 SDR family NAD(P)-dependent oxidoreductase [Xenorhabdus bovienii]